MWYEFIGDIATATGTVLIGVMAISTYDKVANPETHEKHHNHTVTKHHFVGFLGIGLIILGYTLQELGKYSA